jgi:hypothetical protein
MPRSRHTYTVILVMLAIAVAVATAVAVLDLPTAGSVRYKPSDSRSALAQLQSSLQAVGIGQTAGAVQSLLRRDAHPLAFRAATYWTGSDIGSRRNDYLAAGTLLVLTLLLSAVVLEFRSAAPGSPRVPPAGSGRTGGASSFPE